MPREQNHMLQISASQASQERTCPCRILQGKPFPTQAALSWRIACRLIPPTPATACSQSGSSTQKYSSPTLIRQWHQQFYPTIKNQDRKRRGLRPVPQIESSLDARGISQT